MREVQLNELKVFVSSPACKEDTCTAKIFKNTDPIGLYYEANIFRKKKNPLEVYKVTCPYHKSNPRVCPQATHSFGMPMSSGQENATEEQNSTLIRTNAHSDAVSATSNQ